jgi:hypothetical protein
MFLYELHEVKSTPGRTNIWESILEHAFVQLH